MDRMLKRTLMIALAALLLLTAACGAEKPQTDGTAAPKESAAASEAAQPAEEKAPADLQQVYEQICALPEMPEMLLMAEKRISGVYGIDTENCRQAIVAVCGDGLRVDEIWLIEADSEESAEKLMALAEGRIEQICSETENYLPDQYAVAKQAKALRLGCYTALFLSPDAESMEQIFRDSVG